MDTEAAEKSCRYCFEPIDPRATRCPHCRTQQTRWACVLHPAVPALLMLLPFVLFAATGIFFHREFGPGEDFGRHEQQLTAVDTRLEHGEDDGSPVIRVSGKIRNTSRYRWDDIETECRFLDGDGNVIDVSNDWHSMTVRPGMDRSLAISHRPHRPVADYANCEVDVRWANEAD